MRTTLQGAPEGYVLESVECTENNYNELKKSIIKDLGEYQAKKLIDFTENIKFDKEYPKGLYWECRCTLLYISYLDWKKKGE